MNNLIDWLVNNQQVLVGVGVGSAVIFIASLLSLPWLVAKIPEDYFVPKKRQPTQWKAQQPMLRLLALVGKNLIGYGLILARHLNALFTGPRHFDHGYRIVID